MAQRTARFDITSLPEGQRVIASRIIETVPAAQRAEAQRIIQRLCERYRERATDSLMHLETIVRSENFRPQHLGTVSLIVDRSGQNATSALREFSIIIDHEKFNRYVHETVRLAATRAGEDTNEALRALHFLLSNPSFTQRSLNLALPDTFVRFVDAAIRNGGDADYLALRALGDLMANPNFGPAQFTARYARTFGTTVRTVRNLSAPNQYYGLEALGAVLGNSSVVPSEITPAFAEALSRSVQHVIEYTRAVHGSASGPRSAIDESMRTLNLILGNRAFRLDMLMENGILERTLAASTGNEGEALIQFLQLMRSSRAHPQALSAFGSLVSAGNDPLTALFCLNALLSNPALAPMIAREDFVARFGILLRIESAHIASLLQSSASPDSNLSGALTRALRIFNPNQYFSTLPLQLRESPGSGFLALLLADQRITPAILDRTIAAMETLGPNADIAALCLAQLVSNPSFRPQMMDQAFFSNLVALANAAAASPFDFRILSALFMSRSFRPSLIEPNGLIPHILRTRSPDAEDIFRMLASVMDRRAMTPELATLFRETVSISGRSGRLAVDQLGVILQNSHITPNTYPLMLQIVRSTGTLSDVSLRLYNALFSNPRLRPLLTDTAFVTRLCNLINRVAARTGRREAVDALADIMRHPSFRPEMLPQIDTILQQSGASAYYVFKYLEGLQTAEGLDFNRAMQPEFIGFLCRVANFITANGGTDPLPVHSAFLGLIAEMKGDVFLLHEREDEIFGYLASAARSAGPMAPFALRAILPRLPHIDLDEDDAAALGAWIRTYLQGIRENKQRGAAVDGLANMLTAMARNSDLYDILMENPGLFEEGRRLAESLITERPVGADVILNFAYGIQRIGAVRVHALHQRFGMRYFARYSDTMLERLYQNLERSFDPSRPTVFVSFPHWDDNGAFYREGRRLDDLLDTHNVIIFESGSEQGFYQAAYDFRMRYGRTRDVIIGGHGTPASIRLGSDMESGLLDMTDADELRVLRDVLGQEPRVILVSCSTGVNAQAIGGMISRVIGATLFAPREPAGVRSYDVDSRGRITAEFRSERGFFFEGIDVGAGR